MRAEQSDVTGFDVRTSGDADAGCPEQHIQVLRLPAQRIPDWGPQRLLGRLAVAVVGCAMFTGVLAISDPAAAQSRDTYFGNTSGRNGPYAPPAQRPYRSRQLSETDGLLEDALDDLSRGRVLDARRLLELVVERFANTPAADEARRLLAPIYASGRSQGVPIPGLPIPGVPVPGGANGPAASLPSAPSGAWGQPSRSNAAHSETERAPAPVISAPMTSGPITSGSMATARGANADAAAERQWQTEVRRVRLLDQDFRSNVGDRVFFGEASTELGSHSRVVLAAQARWLARYPDLNIVIEAHADDPGSRDVNQSLAARRAEAVRARLVEEGVAAQRLRIVAIGREKPVADCADAGCAAQNRRVVMQLVEPELRSPETPRQAFDDGRRK